jgi:hypothetical protein
LFVSERHYGHFAFIELPMTLPPHENDRFKIVVPINRMKRVHNSIAAGRTSRELIVDAAIPCRIVQ